VFECLPTRNSNIIQNEHAFCTKKQTNINRRKNHWSYYCDNFEGLDGVSECITTPGPKYRCHTSYNSNWSLNAVIVKREVMLHGKPTKKDGSFGWPKESIANYGLSTFDRQDGFEVSSITCSPSFVTSIHSPLADFPLNSGSGRSHPFLGGLPSSHLYQREGKLPSCRA